MMDEDVRMIIRTVSQVATMLNKDVEEHIGGHQDIKKWGTREKEEGQRRIKSRTKEV